MSAIRDSACNFLLLLGLVIAGGEEDTYWSWCRVCNGRGVIYYTPRDDRERLCDCPACRGRGVATPYPTTLWSLKNDKWRWLPGF